jgi:hypothetical protein
MHTHRRIKYKTIVRAFRFPVVPFDEQNPQAHGGVEYTDHCACGAYRLSNVNGNHVEVALWTQPFKPGREVLDPSNRRVYVLSVDGDSVTVRLGGSYGATARYSRSMLRPVES